MWSPSPWHGGTPSPLGGINNSHPGHLAHASWNEGARLSQLLAEGWRPPPQTGPIALVAGEDLLAQAEFVRYEYAHGDPVYEGRYFSVGGNLLTVAASVAANAVYNQYRQEKHRQAAAPRWRFSERGYLYLTSYRFALVLPSGWADISFERIRGSHCEPDGFVLFLAGLAPLKISIWPTRWFYVLFRYLAYGEIQPFGPANDERRVEAMTDEQSAATSEDSG